ncbi:MAG TPA: 6-carboxytetrahydropterin synthase [Candidatus Acidoferrales bacterium]|nr:6-carboxytetrahydropterin synthase [Candidatus Acidoferrales bacterium]
MLKVGTEAGGEARAPGAVRGVRITRRVTFAAGHVLRRPDWSLEQNRRVFGGCAGEHGHNYVLEVTVEGEPDPATGMVVNLKDLDRLVHELIVDRVDHQQLNQVDFLRGTLPTAENLALAFWKELESKLEPASLVRVRLQETENNSAEVNR